jgi:hypothetical protein
MVVKILNAEQLDKFADLFETGEKIKDEQMFTEKTSWPDPVNELAYQGLPGEIVRIIEPHTESDPIAILSQTIIVFGNIIGRGPFFSVEADRHYTNENVVLTGATSKGRKGTSDGIVFSLFSLNSPTYCQEWTSDKIKSGLSSGEGIIYHVRDAAEGDNGIEDKRLFVRETEFGNVLRVLERQGNTLSPVIRQAWDNGNLAILTRNNPLKATNAHISISGHITAAELQRYLKDVEIFNGLANRFLWICVKRSKMLPEGGRFHELNIRPLKEKIKNAIEFARRVGEVKRDEAAREIWKKIYPDLSRGEQGMVGAVLSRAEAHVMRIAVIYALMDKSVMIRGEHLLAAIAFWEYVEASVRFIFGNSTGDKVADRIFDAVCESVEGLTRTEIMDLFSHHEKRERVEEAISLLLKCKKVIIAKSETGGRPSETIKQASTQARKASYAN